MNQPSLHSMRNLLETPMGLPTVCTLGPPENFLKIPKPRPFAAQPVIGWRPSTAADSRSNGDGGYAQP